MKKLCELVGGSRLYGLSTPTSDLDFRYVFQNDELSKIIGLDRFDHLDERKTETDKFGFEIRHYLSLLRKTNTQVVEILFADKDQFTLLEPVFDELVLQQRTRFLSSANFYKSLKGYVQEEKGLASGTRTGTLGKRKEALEKYGYSPKNMTQLLRLIYCGIEFYRVQTYPVNIMTYNPEFGKELLEIKTEPQKFKLDFLMSKVDAMEAFFDSVFKTRDQSKDYVYDTKYANEVLMRLYYPTLTKLFENLPGITFNK